MNETHRESALKISANKALDSYVESLGIETLSQIGAARRRALSALQRPGYNFFSRLGLSTGSLIVAGFALFVVLNVPLTTEFEILKTGEDMEILASVEDLEFYDQLEFYQWLEDENVNIENRS